MGLHETDLSLSDRYIEQMAEHYGPEITNSIANDWQHADLTRDYPDGRILYVRVGEETATHDRPVLYVPGFTEGIVAKAPFAAEMAQRGFDFILPGQYRKEILLDALDKKDATYSQAVNYLGVIESEGLETTTVDVITHSYGSLIFQAMLAAARERGISSFDGANVAMLAPAGTNAKESLPKLGGRFAWHMAAENFAGKDFKDPGGEMMKAGTKNFLASVPRTAREISELAGERVDYDGMRRLHNLGKIMVFGYGKDRLFPSRLIDPTLREAVEKYGVGYAVPISLELMKNGRIRGRKGASHNDEQFNPSRAGAAVEEFLRAA